MTAVRQRKIVLIGPMYPYRGGIAHFINTMYRGLSERGHHVAAVTFSRQYPELFFPGQTQFETSVKTRSDEGLAKRMIDSVNPLTWYQTANFVARINPDIVVIHYWIPFFAPAFGVIARRARKTGAKVVVVVHNAIPHERRPGDESLGRHLLKSADLLITMSTSVTHDIAKMRVSTPISQIHHPVYDHFGDPVDKSDARRSLQVAPDAPTLLFFGFVRRYKGLHVLLESLVHVVDVLPDLRLVVAGEFYEDESFYRDIIEKNDLEEVVDIHAAYIPASEVARYFSAADLVVQPYVTATQSGVAQIAFHFDKPVIVTDVGGLAETVSHGRAGLVVPAEDPRKLAEAIVRFFADNMAAELVEGVRTEKQKYSWDRLYEEIETLET